MSQSSPTTAHATPRTFGAGYLFGIPLGDLGWFGSLLIGVASGFFAFFASTFCAIFFILIYNTAFHGTIDFASAIAASVSPRHACHDRRPRLSRHALVQAHPAPELALWQTRAPRAPRSVSPCAAPPTSSTTHHPSSSTTPSPFPSSAPMPPKSNALPAAIPAQTAPLLHRPPRLPRRPQPLRRRPARPRGPRGVTQYVLLGAGLDTFAHRNPYPSLRVFEVDHPATQQWKRELLPASHLPAPANLTYVPVDFERQSLPAQLRAAGFDSSAPTFFAWLGVVPYLTREAFRATLAFIASQPPSTGVVFDYAQPREALPPREQLAFDSLASRVHLAGEAFQLFFTPAKVAAELAAFYDLEDLGSPEINERYFANRTDGLRVMGTAGRLVSAWL